MIQLFDPAIGARREVTPEEWERRTPDSKVPGGWRLMTVQEKSERDARLKEMRKESMLILLGITGAAGLIGYKVAGTKGAVVGAVGTPALLFVAALLLANR